MPWLIGTDEAGYGPNLGPLVVTATLWHVPDAPQCDDLYERLKRVVANSPGAIRAPKRRAAIVAHAAVCDTSSAAAPIDDTSYPRVSIADSKLLYHSGKGLAELECGVLAALEAAGKPIASWRDAWQTLDATCVDDLAAAPWHDGFDCALPCHAEADRASWLAAALREGMETAGVSLTDVRSRVIFPRRFNELVDRHGNKAELLSRLTLELVRELLSQVPASPALVCCDKHGGRNSYHRLLQESFSDSLVEVHGESRAKSVYRMGLAQSRVEVQFHVGAEQFLSVALASMVSKYLRELAMQAFNEFWRRHVPDLRPTAGYPTDARRFKQAIEPMCKQLGIDDRLLWRCR